MNKGLMEYRAVFILLIFLYHAGLLPVGGTFGVCAFFILSGFCTTLAYKNRVTDNNFNYKQYLRRRLVKYYPLHWLLLVPAFISELFTGYTLVKSSAILVINALLLQSLIPIKEVYFSYNAVSWYLSDTVFFVLVAPFVILTFNKMRYWGGQILFVAVLLVLTSVLYSICPVDLRHPFFYINPIIRLVDFILGVFIGYHYDSIIENKSVRRIVGLFKNNSLLYAMLTTGTVITCVFIYNKLPDLGRLSCIYWIPCVLLLLLCSQCSLKKIKIVQAFGTISFEFFMVHQLCMNFLTKFQEAGFFTIDNKNIDVVIDFVFALLLAIILHRYFTTPILNKLRTKVS